MYTSGSPYPSFYGKTPPGSAPSNKGNAKYTRTPRNKSSFTPTRFTAQAKHSYRTTASSSPSSSEKLSLITKQDDSRYLEHLLYIKDSIEKSGSSRSRTGSPSTDRSSYTQSPQPPLGIKDCLEFCLKKKVENTSIAQILKMDPKHFQSHSSGPKALAVMLNEFGKNMHTLQKEGHYLGNTPNEIKEFQEILEDIYAIIKAFKVLNPEITSFQPHHKENTYSFSTPPNSTTGTLSDAQIEFRQHFKQDVGDIFNLEKSGYKGSKGLSLSVSRDDHEVKNKNAWTNFTNELVGKNIKNLFQKDPEQFMAIMHSDESLAANHVWAPDDGEEIVMKFKNKQEATNFFNHLEKMCDDENIRLQDKSVTITQLWIKLAFKNHDPQDDISTLASTSIANKDEFLVDDELSTNSEESNQSSTGVSPTPTPSINPSSLSDGFQREIADLSANDIIRTFKRYKEKKKPAAPPPSSHTKELQRQLDKVNDMLTQLEQSKDITPDQLDQLKALLFSSDSLLNSDISDHDQLKDLHSKDMPMGFISLLKKATTLLELASSGDKKTIQDILTLARPQDQEGSPLRSIKEIAEQALLQSVDLQSLKASDITEQNALAVIRVVLSVITILENRPKGELSTMEYVATIHTAPKLKSLLTEITANNKEKQETKATLELLQRYLTQQLDESKITSEIRYELTRLHEQLGFVKERITNAKMIGRDTSLSPIPEESRSFIPIDTPSPNKRIPDEDIIRTALSTESSPSPSKARLRLERRLYNSDKENRSPSPSNTSENSYSTIENLSSASLNDIKKNKLIRLQQRQSDLENQVKVLASLLEQRTHASVELPSEFQASNLDETFVKLQESVDQVSSSYDDDFEEDSLIESLPSTASNLLPQQEKGTIVEDKVKRAQLLYRIKKEKAILDINSNNHEVLVLDLQGATQHWDLPKSLNLSLPALLAPFPEKNGLPIRIFELGAFLFLSDVDKDDIMSLRNQLNRISHAIVDIAHQCGGHPSKYQFSLLRELRTNLHTTFESYKTYLSTITKHYTVDEDQLNPVLEKTLELTEAKFNRLSRIASSLIREEDTVEHNTISATHNTKLTRLPQFVMPTGSLATSTMTLPEGLHPDQSLHDILNEINLETDLSRTNMWLTHFERCFTTGISNKKTAQTAQQDIHSIFSKSVTVDILNTIHHYLTSVPLTQNQRVMWASFFTYLPSRLLQHEAVIDLINAHPFAQQYGEHESESSRKGSTSFDLSPTQFVSRNTAPATLRLLCQQIQCPEDYHDTELSCHSLPTVASNTISDLEGFKALVLLISSPKSLRQDIGIRYLSTGATQLAKSDSTTTGEGLDLAMRDILISRNDKIAKNKDANCFFNQGNLDLEELKTTLLFYEEQTQGGLSLVLESAIRSNIVQDSKFFKLAFQLVKSILDDIHHKLSSNTGSVSLNLGEMSLLHHCLQKPLFIFIFGKTDENFSLYNSMSHLTHHSLHVLGDEQGIDHAFNIYTSLAQHYLDFMINDKDKSNVSSHLCSYLHCIRTIREHYLITPRHKERFSRLHINALHAFNRLCETEDAEVNLSGYTKNDTSITLRANKPFVGGGINLITGEVVRQSETGDSFIVTPLPSEHIGTYNTLKERFTHLLPEDPPSIIPYISRDPSQRHFKLDLPGDLYVDVTTPNEPKLLKKQGGYYFQAVPESAYQGTLCQTLMSQFGLSAWQSFDTKETYLLGPKGREYVIRDDTYFKIGPPEQAIEQLLAKQGQEDMTFLNSTHSLYLSRTEKHPPTIQVYSSTESSIPDHIFSNDGTLKDIDGYKLVKKVASQDLCKTYHLNTSTVGVFQHPDTGKERYYIRFEGKLHIFDKTISTDGRDTLCPADLEGLSTLCLHSNNTTLISDAIMLFRERHGVQSMDAHSDIFGKFQNLVDAIVFNQTPKTESHTGPRLVSFTDSMTQADFTFILKTGVLTLDSVHKMQDNPQKKQWLFHALENGDADERIASELHNIKGTPDTNSPLSAQNRLQLKLDLDKPINRILLGSQLRDIESRYSASFSEKAVAFSFNNIDDRQAYKIFLEKETQSLEAQAIEAYRNLQEICIKAGLHSDESQEYVIRTIIQGDPDGRLTHLDPDKKELLTTQCFFYLLRRTEYTHTANIRDAFLRTFCDIEQQHDGPPIVTFKRNVSDLDMAGFAMLANRKRAYHESLSRFSSLNSFERFKLLLYLDREVHLDGGHRLRKDQVDIIEAALSGEAHIFEAGTGAGKTSVMNMYYTLFYGTHPAHDTPQAPPEKLISLVVPSALQREAIEDLNRNFKGFKIKAFAWSFDPTIIDKSNIPTSTDYARTKLAELERHLASKAKGRPAPDCVVLTEQELNSIKTSIDEISSVLYDDPWQENPAARKLLTLLERIQTLVDGDVFDEMHATATDKQRQRNSKGEQKYRDIELNQGIQRVYHFMATAPSMTRYFEEAMTGQSAEQLYQNGLDLLQGNKINLATLFSTSEISEVNSAMGETTHFFAWLKSTFITAKTFPNNPSLSRKCALYKKLFFSTLASASKLKYGADYKARDKEYTAQSFATPTKAANEDSEENVKFNDPYLTTWLTVAMTNKWQRDHSNTRHPMPLQDLVKPNFIRNFGQQIRTLPEKRLHSALDNAPDHASPHASIVVSYLSSKLRTLSPSQLNDLARTAHSKLAESDKHIFTSFSPDTPHKDILEYCHNKELSDVYAEVILYFFSNSSQATQLAFIMSDTREYSESTQSNNALNAMISCFDAIAERRPYSVITHSGTTPSDDLNNVVHGTTQAYTIEGTQTHTGRTVLVPLADQKRHECGQGLAISVFEGHNDSQRRVSILKNFTANFNNGCRILVDTGKAILDGTNKEIAETMINLHSEETRRKLKVFYYDPADGWMVLSSNGTTTPKNAYKRKEDDIILQYFSHRETTGQDLKSFQTPDMGIMVTVDSDTDRNTFLQGYGRGRHQKMDHVQTTTYGEVIMPVSSHSLFYCCSEKVVSDINQRPLSASQTREARSTVLDTTHLTNKVLHDHIVYRQDPQDVYNAIKSQLNDLKAAYKRTICKVYSQEKGLTTEQKAKLLAMNKEAIEHKVFDGSDLYDVSQRTVTMEDVQKQYQAFIHEIQDLHALFGHSDRSRQNSTSASAKKVNIVTQSLIGLSFTMEERIIPKSTTTASPLVDRLCSRVYRIEEAIQQGEVKDFGSHAISDHDISMEQGQAVAQDQQQEQSAAQEKAAELAQLQNQSVSLDRLQTRPANSVLAVHKRVLQPVSLVRGTIGQIMDPRSPISEEFRSFLTHRLNVDYADDSEKKPSPGENPPKKLSIRLSQALANAASRQTDDLEGYTPGIPRLTHFIVRNKQIIFVDPLEHTEEAKTSIKQLAKNKHPKYKALGWTLLATHPFLMNSQDLESLNAYKEELFQHYCNSKKQDLETAKETAVGLELDVILTLINTKEKGEQLGQQWLGDGHAIYTYGLHQTARADEPQFKLFSVPQSSGSVQKAKDTVEEQAKGLRIQGNPQSDLLKKYGSIEEVTDRVQRTEAARALITQKEMIQNNIDKLLDTLPKDCYEILAKIFETNDKSRQTPQMTQLQNQVLGLGGLIPTLSSLYPERTKLKIEKKGNTLTINGKNVIQPIIKRNQVFFSEKGSNNATSFDLHRSITILNNNDTAMKKEHTKKLQETIRQIPIGEYHLIKTFLKIPEGVLIDDLKLDNCIKILDIYTQNTGSDQQKRTLFYLLHFPNILGNVCDFTKNKFKDIVSHTGLLGNPFISDTQKHGHTKNLDDLLDKLEELVKNLKEIIEINDGQHTDGKETKEGLTELRLLGLLTDEEYDQATRSSGLTPSQRQVYVNHHIACGQPVPVATTAVAIKKYLEDNKLHDEFRVMSQTVVDSATNSKTTLSSKEGLIRLSNTAALSYEGKLKADLDTALDFLSNPYIASLIMMMDEQNFIAFIRSKPEYAHLSTQTNSPIKFIIKRLYQQKSPGGSMDLNSILHQYFLEIYRKGCSENDILVSRHSASADAFNVDTKYNLDGRRVKNVLDQKLPYLNALGAPIVSGLNLVTLGSSTHKRKTQPSLYPLGHNTEAFYAKPLYDATNDLSDSTTSTEKQYPSSLTRPKPTPTQRQYPLPTDHSKSPRSTANSVSSPRSSSEDSKEIDETPRSSYTPKKYKEQKQIQPSKDKVPSKRTHTSITPSSSPKTMSQQLKHKTPLTREEQKSPNAKILSPYLPPTSNRTQPTSSNSRASNASPLKQRQKK